MEHVCLVLPVLPDQASAARAFLRELDHERAGDYRASQARIGVEREVWFLAAGADGDQLIAYLETADFARAIGTFSPSQEPFDRWFKASLAAATGVDLNDPPELVLPDVLSVFAR